MRELKFRAWDGDKMYNQVSALYPLPKSDGKYSCRCRVDDFVPDRHILAVSIMQYVGLKDKNGKEIYEGDILKCPNELNKDAFGEYTLREVKFNNGGFLVSYLRSEKGQVIPRDYTASFLSQYEDPKLMLWSIEPRRMTDMEVIGNIHANPDLL